MPASNDRGRGRSAHRGHRRSHRSSGPARSSCAGRRRTHRWCSTQCRRSDSSRHGSSGPDGVETAIEMPITIAGVFRPPVLMNTPTIGESPKDWSRPSGDVAYPISMEMPNYPPQVRDGGVVLLEVALNGAGGVTETRGVARSGDSKARRVKRSRSGASRAHRIARGRCRRRPTCCLDSEPHFLAAGATPQMPPIAEPPYPPAFPLPPRYPAAAGRFQAAAACDFRRRRRRLQPPPPPEFHGLLRLRTLDPGVRFVSQTASPRVLGLDRRVRVVGHHVSRDARRHRKHSAVCDGRVRGISSPASSSRSSCACAASSCRREIRGADTRCSAC